MRVRTAVSWLSILTLAVVAFVAIPSHGHTDSPAPEGYRTLDSKVLVRGVSRYKAARGRVHAVTVGQFDSGAAVRITGGLAGGRVVEREAASAICRREGCLLGVNGDFFDPYTTQLIRGMIDDGVLIRSPAYDRAHLTIGADGRWNAEAIGWNGTVVGVPPPSEPSGPLPVPPVGSPEPEPEEIHAGLNGVNVPPVRGGIVLYTSHWHPTTRTEPGWTEMTIRLPQHLAPDQRQVVEATAIGDSGDAPIPPGGAVLAGEGSGAESLRRLWNARHEGSVERLELVSDTSPDGIETAIGGGPLILRDGRYVPSERSSFSAKRHPRTVAGWDDSGRRWIVAVDGRQRGYSEGMTLEEAADLMRKLGATEAFNLDGGGSTTFVEQGAAVNRPSTGRERPVMNALLAVATEPLIRPEPVAPAVVLPSTPQPAPPATTPAPVTEPEPSVEPSPPPVETPIPVAAPPEPYYRPPIEVESPPPAPDGPLGQALALAGLAVSSALWQTRRRGRLRMRN